MRKGEPVFRVEQPKRKTKKKETVGSSADQGIAESGTRYGLIVNSSFVSVHSYESDTAPIVDYLQRGTKVEIVSSSKGFYGIKFGRYDAIGYVSNNFCREV